MGLIAQRDVLAALAEQLDVPLVSIDGPPPAAPEIEGLSHRFLRQCRAFPVALSDSVLTLAMADPLDFETIAAVRAFSGLEIRTALAAEQEILDAIDKHYGEGERQARWRWRGRATHRRPRTPARHGQRGAGHPPGQRHDRRRHREARQRHPHRAVREGIPRPLPRRRRALQPGAAAARTEGRHHLAPEADGQAEHRRAPPAAGRPHQDQDPRAARWICASPPCPRSTAKAW